LSKDNTLPSLDGAVLSQDSGASGPPDTPPWSLRSKLRATSAGSCPRAPYLTQKAGAQPLATLAVYSQEYPSL
jgi:hypothetical protein